jgi:hypothetical protein
LQSAQSPPEWGANPSTSPYYSTTLETRLISASEYHHLSNNYLCNLYAASKWIRDPFYLIAMALPSRCSLSSSNNMII